jgi:hypothetical protein
MGPVEPVRLSNFTAPRSMRSMHAIAVEFDFVEPLIAVRRRVDQLGELRRDPFGQSDRDAAPARYRPRHAGNKLRRRRMRLVEMIDLADMPGRMGELEADALAMPAGRKATAL